MTTFIASIDLRGQEMERPFMRVFIDAETPEEAQEMAEAKIEGDEVVRSAEPLQPILEAILARIAEGHPYSIGWKHEGSVGPVVITDLDAAREANDGQERVAVPFGSEPAYATRLPWMTQGEARRLAKYLGLALEVS